MHRYHILKLWADCVYLADYPPFYKGVGEGGDFNDFYFLSCTSDHFWK